MLTDEERRGPLYFYTTLCQIRWSKRRECQPEETAPVSIIFSSKRHVLCCSGPRLQQESADISLRIHSVTTFPLLLPINALRSLKEQTLKCHWKSIYPWHVSTNPSQQSQHSNHPNPTRRTKTSPETSLAMNRSLLLEIPAIGLARILWVLGILLVAVCPLMLGKSPHGS